MLAEYHKQRSLAQKHTYFVDVALWILQATVVATREENRGRAYEHS